MRYVASAPPAEPECLGFSWLVSRRIGIRCRLLVGRVGTRCARIPVRRFGSFRFRGGTRWCLRRLIELPGDLRWCPVERKLSVGSPRHLPEQPHIDRLAEEPRAAGAIDELHARSVI